MGYIVYVSHELYLTIHSNTSDSIVYLDDLYWGINRYTGLGHYVSTRKRYWIRRCCNDWYSASTIYDPEGTVEPGDKGLINIRDVKDKILENMGFKGK